MRYPSRRLLLLLLLAFVVTLLAAGCQRGGPTPGASPTPMPPPATLPPLPTRPIFTPTATSTPQPQSVTPTPTDALHAPANPLATRNTPPPTPVEAESESIAGWAYVEVLQTPLRKTPAGQPLVQLRAGERLDVFAATGDRAWLYVHYRPNPAAPALSGWVLTRDVHYLGDLQQLQALASCGCAAAANVTPSPPSKLARVVANKLNLRAGPGVNQPVLGQLHRGDKVQTLGRTADAQWLKVVTGDGGVGWAAARWLRTETPIEELPALGSSLSAVPVPAVPRGSILFQDHPGGAIYVISANGAGLKRLSSGLDPTFSPDGQQIAFVRWEGAGDSIRIIDRTGANERVVLRTNKPRSPTWTPDGQALIYERMTGEKQCRTTPWGCLTDDELRQRFNGQDCINTPFGSYCIADFPLSGLVFTGLERFALNDGQIVDLPTGPMATTPRHHPQQPQVLYLSREGIAITSDDSSGSPQQLIPYANFGAPVYSPDGRFIYVSKKDGDSWNIWRYHADGSGPVALTHPPALRTRPINNVAPALSPDGRFVLFLSDRNGDWQLWIMNSDGSNQRPFAARALADIHFQFDFSRARMLDWR